METILEVDDELVLSSGKKVSNDDFTLNLKSCDLDKLLASE